MPSTVKNVSGEGGGDTPDILWPKVSVGRETVWEQVEQFGQDRAISGEAFDNIAGDFQAQGGDDGLAD